MLALHSYPVEVRCWWPEAIPALRGWRRLPAPANARYCGLTPTSLKLTSVSPLRTHQQRDTLWVEVLDSAPLTPFLKGEGAALLAPGIPPGRGFVPHRAASRTRSTSSSLPPAAIHRVDCWWPEAVPAWSATRIERDSLSATDLHCMRIATAHSPTRKAALSSPCSLAASPSLLLVF